MRHDGRVGRLGPRHRLAVGLVVLGVGLVALLQNLHLIDAHLVRALWPLVLVVAGLLKLTHTRRSRGGLAVGIGLVAVGAVLTLHNYGMLPFPVRDGWPVLLIALGLHVIYRGAQQHRRGAPADADPARAAGMERHAYRVEQAGWLDATAIFSGTHIRCDAPQFEGGEITVALGGMDLDLRQAVMAGERAVLNVFVLFGGVVLKVPAGWSVTLRDTPVLGGLDDKTTPPPAGTHQLVVEGYVLMGGVEVKN